MTKTRAPLPNLPIVRRGIDPVALADYLDDLIARGDAALSTANARIHELERELREAREREEAVHMTYVAATKTKQELVETAEREVSRKRAAAEEEAAQIVADARTEALILLNNAKTEAERLIETAAIEARKAEEEFSKRKAALAGRMTTMSEGIEALERQLRKLAEGALNDTGALKQEIRQDLARYPDLSASHPAPPPETPSAPAAKPRQQLTTRSKSPAPKPPTPKPEAAPAAPAARASAATPKAARTSPSPQPAKVRPASQPSKYDARSTTQSPVAPDPWAKAEAPPPPPATAPPKEPVAAREAPAPGREWERPAIDDVAADRDDDIQAVITDREPKRGSFYSRRSARLPRIGNDNEVLEVVHKMRTKTRDTAAGGEGEEEDVAIHA